jgi:hypothetical protein
MLDISNFFFWKLVSKWYVIISYDLLFWKIYYNLMKHFIWKLTFNKKKGGPKINIKKMHP